jgi:hypothetical protein
LLSDTLEGAKKPGNRGMVRVCGASAFVIGAVMTFAGTVASPSSERSVLLGCLGMELVQNVSPDDGAPDANSGAQPDDGSTDGKSQSPGDDNGTEDDDGTNSDQASPPPPDAAQPPGCIFRNEPLELLV